MKIALLGYGIEGQSAYRYLSRLHPDAEFAIYDEQATAKLSLPEGVEFSKITDFYDIDADLVIRTPPIAPQRISTRGVVTSATKLFFEHCPAPIAGVTGSKGKGTVASLITSILRAGGKKVHLVGNIGEPALDAIGEVAADDVVVYELSSFQLWDMQQSPQIAVVLMIEPDHLDVHANMEEYVAAKANITKFQVEEDVAVYFEPNNYSRQIGEASKGVKIPNPNEQFVHIKDDFFWYGEQQLCSVSALKLPGAHNQDNATAAIAAAWRWVQNGAMIAKGLSDFTGLPHRLKLVRELEGVKYYDDSIATTPGSAMAALEAFAEPKVLILGGSSKGANFTELAQKIATSRLRHILLIGEEAMTIATALDAAKVTHYEVLKNVTMTDIVAKAQALAQSGDVVVMSPSCASFDMFKSYKDRGEQFIAAVQALTG